MPTLLHCKYTTLSSRLSQGPSSWSFYNVLSPLGKVGSLKNTNGTSSLLCTQLSVAAYWTFTEFQAFPMTLGIRTLNSAPVALALAHVLQLILFSAYAHARLSSASGSALAAVLAQNTQSSNHGPTNDFCQGSLPPSPPQ